MSLKASVDDWLRLDKVDLPQSPNFKALDVNDPIARTSSVEVKYSLYGMTGTQQSLKGE
jgi:hypothetical protein